MAAHTLHLKEYETFCIFVNIPTKITMNVQCFCMIMVVKHTKQHCGDFHTELETGYLHWPNHTACSKSYNIDEYPFLSNVNSQISEQLNRSLR